MSGVTELSPAERRRQAERIVSALVLCDRRASPEELAAAASVCATPPVPGDAPQQSLPLRFP